MRRVAALARLGRRAGICLAAGLAASTEGRGQGAIVTGTVFDSLGGSYLAGAQVQFVARDPARRGTVHAVRTDATGGFTLSVPRGEYLAGFFHPAADTTGIEVAPRVVQLNGDSSQVELALPSARTLAQRWCGDRGAVADSAGLFFGHVRSARDGRAVPDAVVSAEWTETVLARDRVQLVEKADTARTTRTGLFVFCALPGNLPLLARAAAARDSSGYVELDLPAAAARHLTFLVGERVWETGEDSLGGRWRGDAALGGVVRDIEGRGIGGARLAVLGTGVEVVANSDGFFRVDSLPPGSWTLETRALGRSPLRQVIQLREGGTERVEVILGDAITTLATATVRGEVIYSRKLQEFERRRRTQFTAKFLTTRELQGRVNTRLSALLQGVQGIEIQRRGAFAMIMMKSTSRVPGLDYCAPSVYVDGVLDLSDDYDRFMADDVLGIEIYPREAQRPPEFTNRHRCGSIAIWLRERPGGG